jgi:hypothetical protein
MVVLDYNPEWPDKFWRLRDRIWPFVRNIAIRIEHVEAQQCLVWLPSRLSIWMS